MPIRAVLFDVGGTLLYPYPSVGDVYSKVAAKHGVVADPRTLQKKFKTAWEIKRSIPTPMNRDWWLDVVRKVFSDHPTKDFDALFEDLYAEFTYPSAWKIFPDVLPTLNDLRSRQLTLAVLSNWDDRLPELLKKMQLDHFFAKKYVSCLVGLAKPDPRFFSHAVRDLGLAPKDVLHVGDDLVNDIEAAKNAGLNAFQVQHDGKDKSNLSEILKIV